MRNEVPFKTFWYGPCENAWFGWQPLIWFSRMGGWPTIQSNLGYYLTSTNKDETNDYRLMTKNQTHRV